MPFGFAWISCKNKNDVDFLISLLKRQQKWHLRHVTTSSRYGHCDCITGQRLDTLEMESAHCWSKSDMNIVLGLLHASVRWTVKTLYLSYRMSRECWTALSAACINGKVTDVVIESISSLTTALEKDFKTVWNCSENLWLVGERVEKKLGMVGFRHLLQIREKMELWLKALNKYSIIKFLKNSMYLLDFGHGR